MCNKNIYKFTDELGEYFDRLTELVESSRRSTSGPVILMAHSYGAPLMNYYLNTKTAEWRKNNIDSMITLAGAWGGSKKVLSVSSLDLYTIIYLPSFIGKVSLKSHHVLFSYKFNSLSLFTIYFIYNYLAVFSL